MYDTIEKNKASFDYYFIFKSIEQYEKTECNRCRRNRTLTHQIFDMPDFYYICKECNDELENRGTHIPKKLKKEAMKKIGEPETVDYLVKNLKKYEENN